MSLISIYHCVLRIFLLFCNGPLCPRTSKPGGTEKKFVQEVISLLETKCLRKCRNPKESNCEGELLLLEQRSGIISEAIS